MPHVYILRCSDDSYYVGSTVNLETRLWQHNHSDDGAAYTRRRRPVTLAWSEEFDSVVEAYAFEKRVQGWRREKREALMRGEYDELIRLSRRKAVRDRDDTGSSGSDESAGGGFEARR